MYDHNSRTYTPDPIYIGYYLRAKAEYIDHRGFSQKTAQATTQNAVLPAPPPTTTTTTTTTTTLPPPTTTTRPAPPPTTTIRSAPPPTTTTTRPAPPPSQNPAADTDNHH